jgi:glycosyltransferase involved in cell wall biosynthesis
MRIAQVAPLAESVPPKLYGGTERVVSWLTEELVALGHDVTLFASGDSQTKAKLEPVWAKPIRLARPRPDPMAAYAALLQSLAERARDFDVIHCHIDWILIPLLCRLGVPFVTTMHGRLDSSYVTQVVSRLPQAPFISISDDQRRPVPSLDWLGTIYHGMPPETLRLHSKPDRYLAFLGRISPEKGPEVAIRLATAAKVPLRIAAKLPRGENRFFQERVQPLVDGENVRFIGEVDEKAKQDLLGKATALLFPIDWPEPFGLVMIEAMACGTPVVAWRRGSVPEIVEDGLTGFVVDNEAEALKAIHRVHELDRDRIRREFERRFTARRMAEDHVTLYQGLVAKQSRNICIE